jgi:hypothetical protein
MISHFPQRLRDKMRFWVGCCLALLIVTGSVGLVWLAKPNWLASLSLPNPPPDLSDIQTWTDGNGKDWPVGFGAVARKAAPHDPSSIVKRRRREPEVQSQSAFEAWQRANPSDWQTAQAYQTYLQQRGVGDVIPLRQLLKGCVKPGGEALVFTVPARETWANIVPTLVFVRDVIIPDLGPVVVYHGYRSPANNALCPSRSPVHPENKALDFIPLQIDDPAEIERRMCAIWRQQGKAARAGLASTAWAPFTSILLAIAIGVPIRHV